MGKAYQRFLKAGIDLAPLGVERSASEATYFCTPKGASIIGWAGVDGIHYCFIRGFGEMVFAVSPENTAPNYVHPLAKTFNDFLRLLLACGDAAALEQAWMWDRNQFDAFLRKTSATPSQKAVLTEIAGKLGLTPIKDSWYYIEQLQSSFDYSKIKYTRDFYISDMNKNAQPLAPEWKVFFDGNFWGHSGRDHAGKKIPIEKNFQWGERYWLIPAAYSCSKGLVIDFCMRIDPSEIQAFMAKWDLNIENEAQKRFSREQQMEIDLDNPLHFKFTPGIMLNGKGLRPSRGCAVSYNPCLPKDIINESEAKLAVDHYGLDPAYGWVIHRWALPWSMKRRPVINTLSLTMKQQPASIPGPHFHAAAPGDSFDFLAPPDGTKHTLTVQEYARQILPPACLGQERWEFPMHYHAMHYTISPEIPCVVTVTDCVDSDHPAMKPDQSIPAGAASIGIIGGADGPTTIFIGDDNQEGARAAYSALHFEPVQDVQWCMVFHQKQFDDFTIELI